jgi:tetratricopeptide (TPR) repeat protein
VARKAEVALRVWKLQGASLESPDAPVVIRAQALVWRGQAAQALSLLAGCEESECAFIRADALVLLGKIDDAKMILQALRDAPEAKNNNADALRTAARATIALGKIQALFAAEWKLAVDQFGRAREADRLDPLVPLEEGLLLVDRHNRAQGVPALWQALSLDPRSSRTWFALGQVALNNFDFDSAARAADRLRLLNPTHPLADLLDSERALLTDDPERADAILDGLLTREPNMPQALALRAAVAGRRWNPELARQRLAEFDEKFPTSALAYATLGRTLSLNRQYEWGQRALEEAIRREPMWSEPRGELGYLFMQAGRDDDAVATLKAASELDPFDTRSSFGLWLMDELSKWKEIDSPHFRIRVKPGIDEVVAELMPTALESMYADVTKRFAHEPAGKTTIEVLPDHEFFAVRITGMPGIHTMAAATGPVIALEVPREGNPKKHLGLFDWLQVLRHEYTHTVTLSQTQNRIPHWLTEALAVSMETKPRTFETCQMLARALANGKLFTLDKIKWAFVRPDSPQDRPLAYAQGCWMVEYLQGKWGADSVPKLLEKYKQGLDESNAFQQTVGVSGEEFYAGFIKWATEQVTQWGLAPEPSLEKLSDTIRAKDPRLQLATRQAEQERLDALATFLAKQVGEPSQIAQTVLVAARWPKVKKPAVDLTDEIIDQWLVEYPDQPDLLELKLRRRLKEQPEVDGIATTFLDAYAKARPVDPYPHRVYARGNLNSGDQQAAITHLKALDLLEEQDPSYALELARLYRLQNNLTGARASVEKAARINPFDAATREFAATLAIEDGDLQRARLHLAALTKLEPDQTRHALRLEKLDAMIAAQPVKAQAAP